MRSAEATGTAGSADTVDTLETDTNSTGAALRIGRALRALRLSGRRLVARNGRWQVRVDRRRRPIVKLLPEDVDLLLAAGWIAGAEGGGYVLTAASVEEVTAAEAKDVACAGPWIYAVAGQGRSPIRFGFAGLALRAQNGEGPLTLRQAAAGLRLVEDAEQAGRDPALTMNWEAGPVDKQRRAGRAPNRLRAARDAERRIRRIAGELGEPVFSLIWGACIEQLPLARLERRHGLQSRSAPEALAAALEKLAEAYDG